MNDAAAVKDEPRKEEPHDLKKLIIIFDYCMVLAGFAILVSAFLKNWNLSGEMIALIASTTGVFSKCIADFHGFEFGSTRGSQAKDSVIANLTNGKEKPHVP